LVGSYMNAACVARDLQEQRQICVGAQAHHVQYRTLASCKLCRHHDILACAIVMPIGE